MWIKLVELTGCTDNIGSYPKVNQLTEDLIKDGWQSDEGWQYYYDHTRRIRHYFSDGKYAWKNLEYWWSNYHQDPNGNYTAWQPK